MKTRLYYLLLIIGTSNMLFSQATDNTGLARIFPPSPEAYRFSTYGNIAVGENSGTVQEVIPLFDYRIGDINLPISINYESNGIKVDDYNSVIGLGWTLQAGGVISRIIRDHDDFLYNFKTQKYSTAPDGLKMNFFENAIMQNNFDTEKDLFRVNIPGAFSNSFIKKGEDLANNEWLQEKQTDYKILTINSPNLPTEFLITSPQGIKYYFQLLETSIIRTHGFGQSLPDINIGSSFFLTKIQDTKNNIVNLEYEPEQLIYDANEIHKFDYYPNTMMGVNCTTDPTHGVPAITGLKTGSNIVRFDTYRIKKISNNRDNAVIEFAYQSVVNTLQNRAAYLNSVKEKKDTIIKQYDFEYLTTSTNRVFLSKLKNIGANYKYEFAYKNPELLPARLSRAQDFWGYYNGQTANSHLIGKIDDPLPEGNYNFSFANRNLNETLSQTGLLSKIVYPTKGYSDIHYEPHTEWGTKKIAAALKTKNLSVLTDQDTWQQTTTTTFYSGKSQKIKLQGGAQYNQDCTYPMTHQVQVTLRVKNLSTNQYESLSVLTSSGYVLATNTYFYPGGQNEYYVDALPGVQYEVSLKVQRICFGGGVSFSYADTPDTIIETNLPVGGNRIAKVEYFDIQISTPVTEKWYYAHKNQLTKSSGINFYKPVMWKYTDAFIYCPPTSTTGGGGMNYEYIPYKYVSIFSNSLIPLFGNESQNITYKYVTKSYGGTNFERGGTFTEFEEGIDPIAQNLFGNGNYRGGNFSNLNWNKGAVMVREQLVKSQSGLLEVQRSTLNEYYSNDAKKEEIESIIGIKSGDMQMIAKSLYTCTAADVINNTIGYNPCFGNLIGYQIPYLFHNSLVMFGELLRYKFYSHDHHLSKVTTTDFLAGSELTSKTEYKYLNPTHYEPTHIVTTQADNTVQETHYNYAAEMGNQYLIDKNMVGIPLETIVVKKKDSTDVNGKIISQIKIEYPTSQTEANNKTSGLPLPFEVLSKDLQTNSLSKEIAYTKYDATNGNIQEYKIKNLTPVAIIWGYNHTQPIAKVEGATYAQVQNLAAAIMAASDTDAGAIPNSDETALLTALDNFRRQGALLNFQITTYTYDPLIGVRSITPPSGIRESYIYDSANRLEKVVDVNGSILKEYKYNYKQ